MARFHRGCHGLANLLAEPEARVAGRNRLRLVPRHRVRIELGDVPLAVGGRGAGCGGERGAYEHCQRKRSGGIGELAKSIDGHDTSPWFKGWTSAAVVQLAGIRR